MNGGNGIAIPTEILEFDTVTGAMTSHFTTDLQQRRPQSIVYNAATDRIVAAYVHSSHLVMVDAKGQSKAFSSEALRVRYPIGMSDIPNTPYVVVAGLYDDMAIIDLRDMSLVTHLSHYLYRSSHTTVYYS